MSSSVLLCSSTLALRPIATLSERANAKARQLPHTADRTLFRESNWSGGPLTGAQNARELLATGLQRRGEGCTWHGRLPLRLSCPRQSNTSSRWASAHPAATRRTAIAPSRSWTGATAGSDFTSDASARPALAANPTDSTETECARVL